MADQKDVFRKVSLERLSSPEQLDQRLRVISPIGWFSLMALAVLIGAALAWGFLGSISNKVNGNGILLYGDGIVNLVADTTGQITDLSVKEGDQIEKGQIVARVSQDELIRQIEDCRDNLRALESISVETLDLDIEHLNSTIYPEFAQLAHQIRTARAQYQAQQNDYTKNNEDLQNRRTLQRLQIASIEEQIELLDRQIEEYTDLIQFQYGANVRAADLQDATNRYNNRVAREQADQAADNYNAQLEAQYEASLQAALEAAAKSSSDGTVYSSSSGYYFVRNYLNVQEYTVYDQSGNAYIVLASGGAIDSALPCFYFDQSGNEQATDGAKYYLPNYYDPANAGTPVPDSRPKWGTTPVVYTDMVSSRRYIDTTGREYSRIQTPAQPNSVPPDYPSRPPTIDYGEQARQMPEYDVTLASMEQQMERLTQELLQASMQSEQLDYGFTEYLRNSTVQTGAQIASLSEQFANIKELKSREYTKHLDELQGQFLNNGQILADTSGTILSVNYQPNDYVQAGMSIGTVIRETIATENTSVVMYVPIEQGKKIKEGMDVNVSPSTVNREEYGYILGRVKRVSEYAVSQESVMATLRNQQLANSLTQGGAVMEVEIELERSNDTVSQYKWSTPKGAPVSIDAGTVCTGEVRVSSQKPIEMVMPFIRKLFSGGSEVG